jgi:hypothetical protein
MRFHTPRQCTQGLLTSKASNTALHTGRTAADCSGSLCESSFYWGSTLTHHKVAPSETAAARLQGAVSSSSSTSSWCEHGCGDAKACQPAQLQHMLPSADVLACRVGRAFKLHQMCSSLHVQLAVKNNHKTVVGGTVACDVVGDV